MINLHENHFIPERNNRNSARPITMWAVVIVNTRSEWINWTTLDRLRKDAWKKYLSNWMPEHHANLNSELKTGKLKLCRVEVRVCS